MNNGKKNQHKKNKYGLRSIIIAIVAIILLALSFSETDIRNILNLDSQPKETETTNQQTSLKEDEATISRVVDGDTVIVTLPDGTEERIRLLLIDTPESVHPNGEIDKFGPEASDYAKKYLTKGMKVTLERGNPERDNYDRMLGYIWVDGVNFNQHMIEEGYARVAYVFEPNTKYIDEFLEAEKRAKKKKLNIWSIPDYVTDRGFDMSVVK